METALILCQFLKFALAMLLCGAGGLQARSFSSGLMHASRQRAVQLVWLGALLNLLAALGWLAAEAALVGDGTPGCDQS